ncbi:uncharacterized protein [Amphiura filiformis]|uniref:uncharacterized protein n=1 Tax=Amphiura filiformis TaxID=82378 RepID=UPI003B21934E
MAVMQTCCCCGVRQGSVASAIYSMVIAIIGIIYFGYSAAVIGVVKVQFGANGVAILDAFFALYILAVIIFIFVVIACIFVFVGISQDSKAMLIPFMVAAGLHLLWYVLLFIVDAVFLGMIGGDILYYGYAYLATIILLIPFLIGDIVCLLCVISQYQEYTDGRGRATDQQGTTQTTVVIQQQAPPPAYK